MPVMNPGMTKRHGSAHDKRQKTRASLYHAGSIAWTFMYFNLDIIHDSQCQDHEAELKILFMFSPQPLV